MKISEPISVQEANAMSSLALAHVSDAVYELLVRSMLASRGPRWPKDWNFSFNISPSDEYSGLISFRMDWLDLLAVQKINGRHFALCKECIPFN